LQQPGKGGELFSRKEAVVDREQFEQMKGEFYRFQSCRLIGPSLLSKVTIQY